MPGYNPEIHHRRSIRLKGYDYAQAGGYYVTMVTRRWHCLFGALMDGEMHCNPAGQMVERWWMALESKYPTVTLGAYVVMPNHFHGVILIHDEPVGVDPRVVRIDPCVVRVDQCVDPNPGGIVRVDQRVDPGPPLHAMIQWFKTMTTNEYIRGVKQLGWAPFDGKLWQRNYYEHIIRDELDHDRIHRYIQSNPVNWLTDDENKA